MVTMAVGEKSRTANNQDEEEEGVFLSLSILFSEIKLPCAQVGGKL